MLKPLLILASLILIFSSSKAQEKWSDNLEIGVHYGSGYVLPEYAFINLATERPSQNIEFQIQKNSTGKTDWERLYKYPSYGIRFMYTDLGSPDILGQVWAIYPYFQIQMAEYKKFKLVNETGLGYSRVNQKFDLEKNYWNVAVGSYGNIHFNTRFSLLYSITDRMKLSSSLSFDHFSNANTAEPNLGINYISWLGGLTYSIGKQSEKIEGDIFPKDKSIEKELVFSVGGKHSRALNSKYYLTNSLSFEFRKKYFRALHLGAGADLFYDTSVKDQLIENEKTYRNSDQFQTGFHISQTLIYHRFSLTIQEGTYLVLKEKVDGYSIYCRGIMKYRFTDHFTGRISMKSHLHILDYPEIGIGWIF